MKETLYDDSQFLQHDIKTLITENIYPGKDFIYFKLDEKKILTYTLDFLYNKWNYKYLSTIVVIERENGFTIKYFINSTTIKKNIIVEVFIEKKSPIFTSIEMIYPVASIFEREINKKYGIIFEGNPETKNILFNYLETYREEF
ncbi:MAG: NADH-quinone oxidoreductase subunit C [candidate division WOR-3 bacterium]